MVEFLGINNYENASSETVIRKLEGYLGGKRFLLVLDDVWNTDQDLWDSMISELGRIGGSKDSMILTTVRADSVAKTMHASSVHQLSELSNDDSWLLFKQIAFANWSNEEAFALEVTGIKIVKKCKGVPLAIKSIAGKLNKKRSPHGWINIEKSELWDIHTKRLGNGNITTEDIGEEYFNELLSISFFLATEKNELGETVYYTLHVLVYDLARSVAMHERLFLEASKKENKAVNIQHLSISDQTVMTLDFPDKKVLENIRSLDMFNGLTRGLSMHVKYLRVLCIKHANIEVVPESIANLKCLKYLDMEGNPIKVLPECIMELYNLQSLCLYDCEPLSELPKRLSNLVNLRHLGLSFYLCPAEKGVIKQLSQLQTLPPLELSEEGFQISEVGGLYHVNGTLDSKGLEVIKNKLDAEKSKLSMKSRVEQLRLGWVNDDNYIKHEEVLDGLHPHANLKLLSLKGYGGEKFPPWLMRMNVPETCNNGYASTFCNLIKIELIDCGRCQQLPAMGHLPLLKWIEMRNMESLKQIGLEFYGGAELLLLGNSNEASSSCGSSPRVKLMVNFSSLKELRLCDLGNLEEWCEPAGPGTWDGFPSLEVLVFDRCWKLKEAPNKFPVLKEFIFEGLSSSKPLIKILSNKVV